MVSSVGQILPELSRSVTQDMIGGYAAVSGDSNPVHVDPEFAVGSSFGRIVAQGMLTLAFVSDMLAQAFGRSWLESGRLKLRFRAPVFPGDTITAYGAVKAVREGEGAGEVVCSVGVRRQTGEDAITGEARVRVRPLA